MTRFGFLSRRVRRSILERFAHVTLGVIVLLLASSCDDQLVVEIQNDTGSDLRVVLEESQFARSVYGEDEEILAEELAPNEVLTYMITHGGGVQDLGLIVAWADKDRVYEQRLVDDGTNRFSVGCRVHVERGLARGGTAECDDLGTHAQYLTVVNESSVPMLVLLNGESRGTLDHGERTEVSVFHQEAPVQVRVVDTAGVEYLLWEGSSGRVPRELVVPPQEMDTQERIAPD